MQDIAGEFSLTVHCAHDDRSQASSHERCDGTFCSCVCHAADDRRWSWVRRWYLQDHPRAAAKVPVGVL